MIKIEIHEADWYTRYISSIYWAVTTMITVGYGDITPINNDEKIFGVFTMLLACGIFGYTVKKKKQKKDTLNLLF